MTTRTQVTALFHQFAGQSGTLVIPRPYIDFCDGDHLAALLLSQILYWSERTDDPDGWFAKSYGDWFDEVGLTDRQVKRIVAGDKRRQDDGFSLKSVGIETKLARSDYYKGAATLHYRANHEVLSEKIAEFSQVLTIGGNAQCGIPPIAQNDDSPIAQNDHIHRLDSENIQNTDPNGSDAPEEKPKRKRSAKQLALDAMKNALADAFGLQHDLVTPTKWNEFGRSGKEMLAVGATPDEMKPLFEYVMKQGYQSFSSMAMTKDYADFKKAQTPVENAAAFRPFVHVPGCPSCNDGMVVDGEGRSLQCPNCAITEQLRLTPV